MIQKNDFVELDFTSYVKESLELFDTTRVADARKAGLTQSRPEEEFKSLRICVGHGMVIKGLDSALVGKEIGKEYEIILSPSEAFGARDPKLVRTMSVNAFRQRGIDPVAGMTLALDNLLVRVSSVSSGRVIVDFNNPLSGKAVVYKFTVNKSIDALNEKLSILSDFFFGGAENISIDGSKASITIQFELPQDLKKVYADRIKEILGIDAVITVVQKKEELPADSGKPAEAGK